VTIGFDSNVVPDLLWRFEPLQRSVTVRLGEQKLVSQPRKPIGLSSHSGVDSSAHSQRRIDTSLMKAGLAANLSSSRDMPTLRYPEGTVRSSSARTVASHQPCCCASRIAGLRLERKKLELVVKNAFRKGKEYRPMRLHIHRNQLDGDLIAFVVISLLIIIALAY
jgi:hypothetical protein